MDEPPMLGELRPPNRTLMGPGPSDVHPDVIRAMSHPVVGHLDAAFLEIMEEVQDLLRYTFRTENRFTIPVSGTGSAAMEAAITNFVEPNDTVLLPTNGYFGERMREMTVRAGGEVVEVDAPWGEPLDLADVDAALERHHPDVFGFVHGETSTGVVQPDVEELVSMAHDYDTHVIVDTVASLGGVEFNTDAWNVDVVYSGSQKCLSAPPGVSPLTVSEAAWERLQTRDSPVCSWYLDLSLLDSYWGDERSYHHTAPISNVYSLREALRRVAEEGIETRWERHRDMAEALKAGVEAMGLEIHPHPEYWLPTLNAVEVPDGVNDAAVINRLMDKFNIEIASGLGDLSGEIFRIGCMGYSARVDNVLSVVDGLGRSLKAEGADVDVGAGVAAVSESFATE